MILSDIGKIAGRGWQEIPEHFRNFFHHRKVRNDRMSASCFAVYAGVLAALLWGLYGCGPTIDDKDPRIRYKAVWRLTDQTLLTRVALTDEAEDVRAIAVDKLTDQPTLARVALFDPEWNIRATAIRKITDSSLLRQIDNPVTRANTIARLNETDSVLHLKLWKTGSYRLNIHDDWVCIVHMKLATLELPIKMRFPRLRCEAIAKHIRGPRYSLAGFGGLAEYGGLIIEGESLTITLRQDSTTIVEASWSTEFPKNITIHNEKRLFFGVTTDGGDLLRKLFQRPEFSHGDLIELLKSDLEEVRTAVTATLPDQESILKVALEDRNMDVRIAAVRRLTDQATLTSIATGTDTSDVRQAATELLTDRSTLGRIAFADASADVRLAAAKGLTDRNIFVKLVEMDPDPRILTFAVEKITDQELLAKFALENPKPVVRLAALKKITNRKVLATVAKTDRDWGVKSTAQERLDAFNRMR